MSFLINSSLRGFPVSKWLDICWRTLGSQHLGRKESRRYPPIKTMETNQFSSIWEGASTKSRATLREHQSRIPILASRNSPCSVEAGILRVTEQAMENVTHFMEEGYYVIMPHGCDSTWSWFREVGHLEREVLSNSYFGCANNTYHGSYRVVSRPISFGIAGHDRPDSSMRIFRFFKFDC